MGSGAEGITRRDGRFAAACSGRVGGDGAGAVKPASPATSHRPNSSHPQAHRSPLSSRTQELHLASQRATLAESVQAVAEEAKAAAASGAGPATRGEAAAEEATGTEGVVPTLKLKSGGRRALSSSSPADSPRSHRAAQVGEQRL